MNSILFSIKNMKQNTPDSVQRYLKKKNITISDWVDDGLIFDQLALNDISISQIMLSPTCK